MNAPPPGYNASESMLEGGTAPITSVMGGGAQKKQKVKRALRLVRKKLSKRAKGPKGTRKRMRGGAGHYMLSSDDAFETLPEIDTLKVQKMPEPLDSPNAPNAAWIPEDLTDYENNMNELWKRYGGSAAVQALAGRIMPSNPAKALTQTGSDRLCAILPNSTKKIVLIPPIAGNIEIFKKYISMAFGADKVPLNDNTAYICTCPFFGDDATNKELFEYFVQVKKEIRKTSSRVYILTQHSAEHINKSRTVSMAITVSSDTTSIYPLLEPSYIVYPYAVNITQLNADGLVLAGVDPDRHKGLLFSGRVQNEPVLPAADPSMEGLIGALLKNIQSETYGIAYKPTITKVDPELASMDFRVIESNLIAQSFYYTYTKEAGTAAVSELDGFSSIFLANSDAYTDDVSLVPVELGAQEFSVRGFTPQVKEDWKNAIFTAEEANFLNSLNVNPQRLSKLYAESWKTKLADVLTVISRSKCFKDTSIILHAQCQEVQTFIAKVFEDFANNAEDIIDSEKNQMQATVAKLTAQVLDQKTPGSGSCSSNTISGSKDIFDVAEFSKAFFTPPNPTYSFVLAKYPFADVKMNASPGFTPGFNEFSIDTLIIDLLNKEHYVARFGMLHTTIPKNTALTEKQISDANKAMVTEYWRIKKETEKAASASKFPRYQIILPE
jgi:hypothetical protein